MITVIFCVYALVVSGVLGLFVHNVHQVMLVEIHHSTTWLRQLLEISSVLQHPTQMLARYETIHRVTVT